jgi:hypothetical protein
MWCAFKSIGAVKIKQPKELALDRLHYYVQRELSGIPTMGNITSDSENRQARWNARVHSNHYPY